MTDGMRRCRTGLRTQSPILRFASFLLGCAQRESARLTPATAGSKALSSASGTAMKKPAALLLVLLSGCWLVPAVAQQAPPQPSSAAPPPSAGAPAQTPPQNTVAADYLIGPGDSLQIFVWRNPELSQNVPVRPDGKISTPLVEDMVAVGKTPSQLARDMEKVLAEYIRSPQVNVIVSVPVSAFSQIKVIGQVATPQSLAFREGMKVLDAVLAAGGLGPYAAGNRAKIVRKTDGKETELRVKLSDLINKGDMKQNLELKPGDVLVVPESFF
jgi:polysaccharide biosynthesis/export protein